MSNAQGPSRKHAKISRLIQDCPENGMDPHYTGYFQCFNQTLFYEAHDVLEELWLEQRRGPEDLFYKGLIQLAGAFVHLQKNRLQPAGSLFKLARTNLQRYPAVHQRLAVCDVLGLIESWIKDLESGGFQLNPLSGREAPKLTLLEE